MATKQTCRKCKKEFLYNEAVDMANNDLIPKKIRKYIIDPSGSSFPLYAMPKDKRRLINEKLIDFECSECNIPV